MKQSRQGSPTGIQLSGDHVEAAGRIEVMRILNEFTKGWNPGVLSKYYQSPTKLYASHFMLPGTVGGLTAGREFTVQKGKTYPIEILISEVPGGFFGFAVLIQQKEGGAYDNSRLDLFRTNFSTPPSAADLQHMLQGHLGGAVEMPRFNGDAPIWLVVP